MIEGFLSRAILNNYLINFSDSPIHLLTKSADETEKKVPSHSVAQALARKDLPVPGGPYNKIPLQGWRVSSKSCGKRMGKMTASLRPSLAPSRPDTSDHLTLGFSVTITSDKASASFFYSSSSSSPPPPPYLAAFLGATTGSFFLSSTVFLMYSARDMY